MPVRIAARGLRASACALCCGAALLAPARAADAPSYGELLRQSLGNAPLLMEQAAQVRAAGADARQARAWPNPSFSALAENLNAPASGGNSQRQETYSITQPIEIGGKRAARIEAGESALGAAQARERQVQLVYAGELALAYANAEAMQQRRVIATDDLARANEDLRAARALVQSGKEADLRVAQAASSVAAAQAAEQKAAADVTEALARLSALAGAREPYSGLGRSFLEDAAATRLPAANPAADAPNAAGASGALSSAVAPAASTAVSPAVARAAAERDALASQARYEEKKWIPDIGVTAGTRSYGWTSQNGLVVGVNIAIPLFDRNSGAIEAARQRALAAEARLEAAKLDAEANRRAAQAQAGAAEQRLEAARQGEAAAAEAYRLGRIGYESGKTSLLELLAIRRALSEARLLTIDARLSRVRALAALALADGRIPFGEAR
jgi:cobalt-zinc-cadmium efflux system outer membrane protein